MQFRFVIDFDCTTLCCDENRNAELCVFLDQYFGQRNIWSALSIAEKVRLWNTFVFANFENIILALHVWRYIVLRHQSHKYLLFDCYYLRKYYFLHKNLKSLHLALPRREDYQLQQSTNSDQMIALDNSFIETNIEAKKYLIYVLPNLEEFCITIDNKFILYNVFGYVAQHSPNLKRLFVRLSVAMIKIIKKQSQTNSSNNSSEQDEHAVYMEQLREYKQYRSVNTDSLQNGHNVTFNDVAQLFDQFEQTSHEFEIQSQKWETMNIDTNLKDNVNNSSGSSSVNVQIENIHSNPFLIVCKGLLGDKECVKQLKQDNMKIFDQKFGFLSKLEVFYYDIYSNIDPMEQRVDNITIDNKFTNYMNQFTEIVSILSQKYNILRNVAMRMNQSVDRMDKTVFNCQDCLTTSKHLFKNIYNNNNNCRLKRLAFIMSYSKSIMNRTSINRYDNIEEEKKEFDKKLSNMDYLNDILDKNQSKFFENRHSSAWGLSRLFDFRFKNKEYVNNNELDDKIKEKIEFENWNCECVYCRLQLVTPNRSLDIEYPLS